MMSVHDTYPLLSPLTRADWRAWLEANHATAPGIRLVFVKKNSGASGVGYEEAVEEALCYGWIDSKGKGLDAEHTLLTFSPRKPGGVWAKSNKERVARLIEQGLMMPAGMAKIEQAQADGSWDALEEMENLMVPDDLEAALGENEAAARNFAAFPPGARRTYLWWIKTAKRPETRAKRIAETVRLVADNVKNPQPTSRPDQKSDRK